MNLGFRPLTFATVLLLPAVTVASADPGAAGPYARLPIAFEQSAGPDVAAVQFVARGPAYSMSLTSSGPRLILGDGRVAIDFVGGNPRAPLSAGDALPGRANYFLG